MTFTWGALSGSSLMSALRAAGTLRRCGRSVFSCCSSTPCPSHPVLVNVTGRH